VYPNVPDKYLDAPLASTGPEALIEWARGAGWDFGDIPHGVVFTYQPFVTGHLSAHPERFKEAPELAASNGRFFRVSGTAVGVACLGIGPSAVTAQLENLTCLGTRRFISIGGAAGINDELTIGQPVLLTAAIRDDGVSQHYVVPSRYAHPSTRLTEVLRNILSRRFDDLADGSTWTVPTPHRVTAREITEYATEGVQTIEMEAAALFAVAQLRNVEAASAVVISDIHTSQRSEIAWQDTIAPLLLVLDAAVEAVADDA
jgi:uridine phosphorylase